MLLTQVRHPAKMMSRKSKLRKLSKSKKIKMSLMKFLAKRIKARLSKKRKERFLKCQSRRVMAAYKFCKMIPILAPLKMI